MADKFTVDTREFDRTVAQYMKLSKRDFATALNTKAFYIARRATVETPKTDAKKIRDLRNRAIGTGTRYKGGVGKKITVKAKVTETRAAHILQARRLKAGKSPIPAASMAKAARSFVAARLRSVAFLKSGWLPAIKKLAPLAEKRGLPRVDKSAKQYGKPFGGAVAARDSFRPMAVIFNHANPNDEKTQALLRYGQPALQRAFDAEVASMREYIERKLKESARRLQIKQR